jgi:hypothetical protein
LRILWQRLKHLSIADSTLYRFCRFGTVFWVFTVAVSDRPIGLYPKRYATDKKSPGKKKSKNPKKEGKK